MNDTHARIACNATTVHHCPPQSEETVELTDAYIEALENETRVTTPKHQYLYKPVNTEGDVAVLLMNSDSAAQELTADFSAIPGVKCASCRVLFCPLFVCLRFYTFPLLLFFFGRW